MLRSKNRWVPTDCTCIPQAPIKNSFSWQWSMPWLMSTRCSFAESPSVKSCRGSKRSCSHSSSSCNDLRHNLGDALLPRAVADGKAVREHSARGCDRLLLVCHYSTNELQTSWVVPFIEQGCHYRSSLSTPRLWPCALESTTWGMLGAQQMASTCLHSWAESQLPHIKKTARASRLPLHNC